jgi:hypothetical protein
MGRLWKVAWCLFDEKKQKAQAEQWVEDRLRMLLDGKVGLDRHFRVERR